MKVKYLGRKNQNKLTFFLIMRIIYKTAEKDRGF